MARVFLSYRRADGPYAVGWIAERLARLDEVTDVRTAFYDTELRAGDQYPAALDAAVAECDVLLAVVGPNWRGERPDGTARIDDPEDWVAREISAALARDVVVLPVLVGGAEPLHAAALPPDHAPLAELHALRFDRADDLDAIVEHLRSHLDDIDRGRAIERGLSDPLTVPTSVPSSGVLVAAMLAAAVGAVVGWSLFEWFGTGTGTDTDPDSLERWTAATATLWAMSSAAAVTGLGFVSQRFRAGTRIRWAPVLLAFIGAISILAWTGLEPTTGSDGRVELGQWIGSTVAVVLLAPWALALTGAAWSTVDVDDRDIGGRAQVIGRLSQASLVSSGVIAFAAVLGVFTTAYAGASVDQSGLGEQLRIIGQGGLYTALLITTLTWSRTRLERLSVELRADLAAVPPAYRRHAEPLLVTEPYDHRARWIVPVLLLPLLAAVVAAFVISG